MPLVVTLGDGCVQHGSDKQAQVPLMRRALAALDRVRRRKSNKSSSQDLPAAAGVSSGKSSSQLLSVGGEPAKYGALLDLQLGGCRCGVLR